MTEEFQLSEWGADYLKMWPVIRDLKEAFEGDLARALDLAEDIASEVFGDYKSGWRSLRGNRSLQRYKQTWARPQFYFHFTLWLSMNSLRQRKFTFLSEVENRRAGRILRGIDRIPKIKKQIEAVGSIYRHPKNERALSYQVYHLSDDLSDLPANLRAAYEDHRFLIPIIDHFIPQIPAI